MKGSNPYHPIDEGGRETADAVGPNALLFRDQITGEDFHGLGKHLTGGAVQVAVGEAAGEFGGLRIDLDDAGAVFFSSVGQVVGRHDRSRGADDQHQVAGLGQFKGGLVGRHRNVFAKKDDVGFNEAAAGAVDGAPG